MIYDKISKADEARNYFRSGYNCCQSVAMAFADCLNLGKSDIAKLASGFGGGMGRMREVCGCVSAMTMVAGAVCPASDPSDKAAKTANYTLVQKLATEFKDLQGSIVCRDLLGIRSETAKNATTEGPVPSDRTPEYYRSRGCADFVACAAYILADNLNKLQK